MTMEKEDLDDLIAKAGIGRRSAKKLHEANGTADNASPASPPKRGGHGSSVTEQPNFGSLGDL